MYEIKTADTDSIEAIVNIENSSFTCPWSEKMFTSTLENDSFYLKTINKDDVVCGFYCVMIIGEEAELLNIAVSAEYRKLGLGNALITDAIKLCSTKGVTDMFLEVRESNIPARSLYEKHKFEPIGIRKNYYTDPRENAVLMQKKFL